MTTSEIQERTANVVISASVSPSTERGTVTCTSCQAKYADHEAMCPSCSAGTEHTTPTETVLTPAERIRAALLTTAEVKALPAPAPLVDGMLYLDSLAMLYGPSGVGKSFVAEDWTMHVAHGSWWQGKAVTAGPVLYVIAEGAAGFGSRLDAWQRRHQLSSDGAGIDWLPWAVNVADPGWAGALAEVVAERRPALVVLDTFARCSTGTDENSARDVGQVIVHLDVIRRAAGSCVLLVHHSGKDSSAGARGSSALRAAMDTEIEVTGEAARFVLKNTKQKNAAEAAPISLGLRPVEGTDSVVVDRPAAFDADELPASAAATLAALASIDVPGGVGATEWRKVADVPDRTFYRHRSGLLDHGLVVNIGTDGRPRYRPASALAPQEVDQ